MKPQQALEYVSYAGCDLINKHGGIALGVLLGVVRRDWAVRVLDAHAVSTDVPAPALDFDRTWCVRWLLVVGDITYSRWTTGHADPDAARLAAARAVFPSLSADVRAELGECP